MNRTDREKGFILYVLVAFVVLGASLALSMRGTFQAVLRDRPRERSAFAATYAAAGGIEMARAALALDGGYAGGNTTVGRGSAVVEVRAAPGEPDVRVLVSVGSIPGPGIGNVAARRRIEARVRLGAGVPRILSWRED